MQNSIIALSLKNKFSFISVIYYGYLEFSPIPTIVFYILLTTNG